MGTIVEESQGSVVEYQGELITIKYFDNVAGEINDLLEGSGMLKIGRFPKNSSCFLNAVIVSVMCSSSCFFTWSMINPCALPGDVAIQYSLSSEMVLSILGPRIGAIINGHMQGGMIYTSSYINRIKAQLKGAIRGITSPTSITAVARSIGLEESGISNIINGVVDGLLSEQAIQVCIARTELVQWTLIPSPSQLIK